MADLKYKDITEKIIGASFEVHKFLGNGFQEVIYQRVAIGMKVETLSADLSVRNGVKAEASAQAGSEFIIQLPIV